MCREKILQPHTSLVIGGGGERVEVVLILIVNVLPLEECVCGKCQSSFDGP